MNRFLLPLVAAVACTSGAFAQELRPGLYRQETLMQGPGAPARPMASQECVTKKDIEEGLVRLGQDKDEGCKASDVKRAPGKVSYRVKCEESAGEVQGTYAADSYEFNMTASPKGAGGKSIKVVTRGTRVGDCK